MGTFIDRIKADIVFLAPPWGGPEYIKKEVFLMTDFPQSIDIAEKHQQEGMDPTCRQERSIPSVSLVQRIGR